MTNPRRTTAALAAAAMTLTLTAHADAGRVGTQAEGSGVLAISGPSTGTLSNPFAWDGIEQDVLTDRDQPTWVQVTQTNLHPGGERDEYSLFPRGAAELGGSAVIDWVLRFTTVVHATYNLEVETIIDAGGFELLFDGQAAGEGLTRTSGTLGIGEHELSFAMLIDGSDDRAFGAVSVDLELVRAEAAEPLSPEPSVDDGDAAGTPHPMPSPAAAAGGLVLLALVASRRRKW